MIFLLHQVACNINQMWCNETASKLSVARDPITREVQSGEIISKIHRPFGIKHCFRIMILIIALSRIIIQEHLALQSWSIALVIQHFGKIWMRDGTKNIYLLHTRLDTLIKEAMEFIMLGYLEKTVTFIRATTKTGW